MRWTSASRRPAPSWNALTSTIDVVGLAVAAADLDSGRVRHQPVDDHLAVAHVVFFDLRPFADAAQLDQRVARVALVLGADDVLRDRLRRRARARRACGRARSTARPDPRATPRAPSTAPSARPAGCPCRCSAMRPEPWPITSCMFGRQLAGDAAPLLGALGFFGAPGELAAELRQRRLVVGLVGVRQRHGLAAVTLADRLVVRQVDADRRDRARIAGLDHDVDGVGGHAAHALLLVLRRPTASGPRTTAPRRRACGCPRSSRGLT